MTTRSTANYSGALGFHSIRKYKVVWFWDLNDLECSYRFKADEASQKTAKLLKQGFKLKPDPFQRKPMSMSYGE